MSIKPALTVEEWDKSNFRRDGLFAYVWDDYVCVTTPAGEDYENVKGPDRYALAALCLHEQPFGFTREDVENCRTQARIVERQANARETTLTGVCVPWRDLADRIEALLPPEDT